MNGVGDHRQGSIANLEPVVHRRDVLREFGDDLLLANATRFELAAWNKIVATKDLGHDGLGRRNGED